MISNIVSIIIAFLIIVVDIVVIIITIMTNYCHYFEAPVSMHEHFTPVLDMVCLKIGYPILSHGLIRSLFKSQTISNMLTKYPFDFPSCYWRKMHNDFLISTINSTTRIPSQEFFR